MPTLSVVIPAYNSARFLGGALNSVLAQTRRADEIIVVDDGSTDDTADVLNRFQSLQVISHENRGLAAARNSGIAAAGCDYIAFLDADDLWSAHHLEFIERAIAETNATWLCTGWEQFDGMHLPRMRQHSASFEVRSYDYFSYAASRNRLLPSATVVATSALRAVGGFPADIRRSAEDKICWARLAAGGNRICMLSVVTCQYRQHEQSISAVELKAKERIWTVLDRHRVVRDTAERSHDPSVSAFLSGMALRTLRAIVQIGASEESLLRWDAEWSARAGWAGRAFRSALPSSLAPVIQLLIRATLRLRQITESLPRDRRRVTR